MRRRGGVPYIVDELGKGLWRHKVGLGLALGGYPRKDKKDLGTGWGGLGSKHGCGTNRTDEETERKNGGDAHTCRYWSVTGAEQI